MSYSQIIQQNVWQPKLIRRNTDAGDVVVVQGIPTQQLVNPFLKSQIIIAIIITIIVLIVIIIIVVITIVTVVIIAFINLRYCCQHFYHHGLRQCPKTVR